VTRASGALLAAMQIHISDLGSMNGPKRRLELDLMLQLWRASHEHVETRILA